MQARRRAARSAWPAMLLALGGCASSGSTRLAEPGDTPSCAPGQYIDRAFRSLSVRKGVVYSRPSDGYGVRPLRMDIYQPEGDAARTRPAIVWVHGGSFKIGGRADMSEFAKAFAQRGYVTASIDYRLLRALDPLATVMPAAELAQSDAQAAIRFLRTHAANLRLDPSRIAIAGYSAGSITAFQVGYKPEFLGDNADNPGPPHTVSAVVGMDGFLVKPADLEPGDPPFALFRSSLYSERDESAAIPGLLARAEELEIPAEVHVVNGTTHLTLVRGPHVRTIVIRAAPFLRRFVACR